MTAVYFRKLPGSVSRERMSVLEFFKSWEVKPKYGLTSKT
jgi:hypothetical protein